MALLGRGQDPPLYETRCANCDVSFPVETRTCIHCGGPTGQPLHRVFEESPVFSDEQYDMSGRASTFPTDETQRNHAEQNYGQPNYQQNDPIEPTSESPFSIGTSIEDSGFGSDQTNDRELETSDGPPTVVGSLIRSLGSFIWVILLIGFSLARSCGD